MASLGTRSGNLAPLCHKRLRAALSKHLNPFCFQLHMEDIGIKSLFLKMTQLRHVGANMQSYRYSFSLAIVTFNRMFSAGSSLANSMSY